MSSAWPKLTRVQREVLEIAAAGIERGRGGLVEARRDTITRLRALGLVEQVGRGITPDGLRAIGRDGLIIDGRVDLRIRDVEAAHLAALDDYAYRDWAPVARRHSGAAAVGVMKRPIKPDDVVRDADGTAWKVIVAGRTTLIVEGVERPGWVACFPSERVTVVDQDAEMATLIGERAWGVLGAIRRDGLDAVKRQVAAIEGEAGDESRAHDHEDVLHQAVLAAIATGAPNAPELAREALKTCAVNFPRYCD